MGCIANGIGLDIKMYWKGGNGGERKGSIKV